MATIGPITSLHDAANGNFVNGVYAPAADGFNLADVSSAAQLDALPPGVMGLVWLGMTDGVTPAFIAAVNACIGNPNLYGFYLADEPAANPTIAANLKAEADYIKANVPGAVSFMVEQNFGSNTSPSYYYTPANTDINLFGLDPYPVQTNVPNNLDYNIIPTQVAALENAGVPLADIVPVYQAFGGGSYSTYILPTPAQEQQILATWASVVPNPAFDMAYSWGVQSGDTALSTDPALAAVFAAQNGAAPVFLTPANGSTDTTTTEPVISGTGGTGEIVTLSIGSTVLSSAIAVASDGSWTYTPTTPLANGVYTLTATQAAPSGPSSTAATDTFTVLVGSDATGGSIINTLFSGISDPNNYPPENALAVGPSYVVMAESSKIEWTNLTGGAAVNQSLYSLFGSLPSSQRNSLLDARVAYDSVNQRFVVMAENLGSNESNIDIAVSKDSNPNDGWYVGSANSLLTINGSVTYADMPYLSVDGTNIYVSENQYGSGLAGTQEWVFGDSGIYSGGELTTVASQVAPASQGNARNVSDGNGNTYYVSAMPTSGQTVLTFQTYNSATNSFNTATSIPLGDSDKGSSSSDYTVAQAGTSLLLDAYDSRVASLAYANGYVYGVSEIEPSGSTLPEIEWFKINVSNPNKPVLAGQGQITGAAIGSNVGVFNASLAVDAAGDVLVNFTASDASMYPSDYYVYETAGNSTFSAPVLYQSSNSYFSSGASGVQRWGTYSTTIVDPNNPNSFWISNEYVTNTGVTIPTGLSAWWDTVTAQVQLGNSTPPTLGGAGAAATYTEGGSAATLDSGLTVSDPSSATLSGATITIASGLLAGDTLSFTAQSGITGAYNASTGALTLSGSASLAAYQAALDSVTFLSSGLNPTNYGADAARTINWQVSAGALQSAAVSSSVNVVGVDQPPALSGAGNIVTYTAGGVAVVIDGSLAVSDPDSKTLASATVAITSNLQAGDQLNFANQNGITGNYNAGVLTLNGQATLAQYQAALDSVTFSTTSTTAASRGVNWQVSDGALNSAAATSTVAIGAQPPTLGGAGYNANWIQAVPPATTSAPIAVDPTLTVADASSTTLTGATIKISAGLRSGDSLSFTAPSGITGAFNASTGALTLSGSASLAAYQAALDSVTFTSTNANPTNKGSDSTRTISWTATSGALTSAALTNTINLGQTYTLTTSRDTIGAGAGNDTIVAPSPSTINTSDSINGGGGTNTLLLQGTGSFNLGAPKTLSNIQAIVAPGASGGSTSVTLRSGLNNLAVQVGGGSLNETFSVNAGGSSNDTFVMTPDFGKLTIANFAASGSGQDILQFQASMFSYLSPSSMTLAQEVAAVLSHATQSGSNTVISDSLGDTVTLSSISLSTLSANTGAFKFV